MRVVGPDGHELGTVDSVKLPSTDQVTTQGSENEGGGLLSAFIGDRGPDVPEPLRSRLLMSGYGEVDGPGILDSDRYVPAGLIVGVSDGASDSRPAARRMSSPR